MERTAWTDDHPGRRFLGCRNFKVRKEKYGYVHLYKVSVSMLGFFHSQSFFYFKTPKTEDVGILIGWIRQCVRGRCR